MSKFLNIFVAIAALIAIGSANGPYEDIVMQKYNNSCIETANWQYVFIAGIEITNLTTNQTITVHELKTLQPKSVFAEIINH